MERFVWLRADEAVGPWETRRALIERAAAVGVDGILVDAADVSRVHDRFDGTIAAFHAGGDSEILEVTEAEGPTSDIVVVGKDGEGDGTVIRPTSAADSGDIALLADIGDHAGAYVRIDGDDAIHLAEWAADRADYLLIERPDWEIIPLENLIAEVGSSTTVVAAVDSAEAAETAFETLEIGADGVLLTTTDPAAIEATMARVDRLRGERLDLAWATVTACEPAGSADRVCVDTGTMFDEDEGLLVGSHARGLVFVHAETADGPYTAPRPFRVNAGAVHAYARTPDGKTRYLAELGGGDRVLVSRIDGRTREAIVGRAKIERRPMRRLVLETADGDVIETLLQDAETVRVHVRDTGAVPVTDLAEGADVAILSEDVPRHFGTAVGEETLIER